MIHWAYFKAISWEGGYISVLKVIHFKVFLDMLEVLVIEEGQRGVFAKTTITVNIFICKYSE